MITNFKIRKLYFSFVLILCVLISACDRSKSAIYTPQYGKLPENKESLYVIGIHPLHNPQHLLEVFGPMADLLTEKIDEASFKIEASRNYAAYDEKLYAGKFEFALPNPYQTILSLKYGYRIFGKMGDDNNFRGIILVRKDNNITKVSDLKGKSVSFPAPTALAATMMPQYYLYENGIDVNKDIDVKYVGSQESSIMNVFLRNTDAGATWPPPWQALCKENPKLLEELEVKWETEPLPNNGLVVRVDVPQNIIVQVSEILFSLHESTKGKVILESMELSRFESASAEVYEPVNKFLIEFNSKIRTIEH